MSSMSGEDVRRLLDEIDRCDLPETWQTLADSIGVVNVIKLCKVFGGTSLYVPKLDSIVAPAKRRVISKEFTGNNHKDLAKRFELSERSVYDIVMEGNWRKNQLSLF